VASEIEKMIPNEWFAALANWSQDLGAPPGPGGAPDFRRSVQVGVDVQWPFESHDRYADTIGRLEGLGFTDVSVHWPRPAGRGVPPKSLGFVTDAHGLSAGQWTGLGSARQRTGLGSARQRTGLGSARQ
jgi:hypothetical protein